MCNDFCHRPSAIVSASWYECNAIEYTCAKKFISTAGFKIASYKHDSLPLRFHGTSKVIKALARGRIKYVSASTSPSACQAPPRTLAFDPRADILAHFQIAAACAFTIRQSNNSRFQPPTSFKCPRSSLRSLCSHNRNSCTDLLRPQPQTCEDYISLR